MSRANDVLTWLEECLEDVPDHDSAHVVLHRDEIQLAIDRLRSALDEECA